MLGNQQNQSSTSLMICWKDIDMSLLKKNTHLADSYEADLIYGIINGKYLTAKHFSYSIGL